MIDGVSVTATAYRDFNASYLVFLCQMHFSCFIIPSVHEVFSRKVFVLCHVSLTSYLSPAELIQNHDN